MCSAPRCSNASQGRDQTYWAFNYCPTPYSWLVLLGLLLYLAAFAPGGSTHTPGDTHAHTAADTPEETPADIYTPEETHTHTQLKTHTHTHLKRHTQTQTHT